MNAAIWAIVGVVAWFAIVATAIMVVHCGNRKPWPERTERFRK